MQESTHGWSQVSGPKKEVVKSTSTVTKMVKCDKGKQDSMEQERIIVPQFTDAELLLLPTLSESLTQLSQTNDCMSDFINTTVANPPMAANTSTIKVEDCFPNVAQNVNQPTFTPTFHTMEQSFVAGPNFRGQDGDVQCLGMDISNANMMKQLVANPREMSINSNDSSGSLSPVFSEHDEDGNKKVCLVCSDLASGLHYGVASCEACKAFFKRTIQGNIDYSCPAKGHCEINKRRRKACQACRFQKCLTVGMLREGVRLDRVRGGRQKYRRLSSSNGFGCPDAKYFMTGSSHLIKTMVEIEPAMIQGSPDYTIGDTKLQYMTVLSDIADRELVSTIGWARLVPGFNDLDLTDQMFLIQNCWLEILCINLIFRSCPYTGTLKFSSEFSVTKEEMELYGVPLKLDILCRKLAGRLTDMHVTQEEFATFKGILLFNTDCEVSDKKTAQNIRETFYKALEDCSRKSNLQSSSRMADILTILQPLTKIKLCAMDYWSEVKLDGQIQLHKLFLEMLEVE